MNGKVIISTLIILFSAFSVYGQVGDPSPSATPSTQWRKDGQFLTIEITKSQPVRVYVVGREKAEINLSKLKLTIIRTKPFPPKILQMNRYGQYYEVTDVAGFEKSKQLEIHALLDGKLDTFHLDLNEDEK
jgi:hypothetical protein